MATASDPRYQPDRPAFGAWLLQQAGRPDAVGALAKCAKADRSFPRDGDPRAISRRLNQLEADPDMHMALEDAELDWLCV